MIETTKERYSSHGDAICPECGSAGEYSDYLESKEMQCEGWDGPCERRDAVRFHMMTSYIEEEENYRTLCPECQKRSNEYWEEMWETVR